MVYRGSYIRAHVLLNLLTSLRTRDKMLDKPRILSLFPTSFNKFNNSRAQMLDDFKVTSESHYFVNTLYFCHYVRNVAMDAITLTENL